MIEFHLERELWNQKIALYMRDKQTGGYATHVTMESKEFGTPADPFLRLELEEAQKLMDELWNVGLRPSEGTGSAGSLRATEKHLQDMQLIAFKLLDKHIEIL